MSCVFDFLGYETRPCRFSSQRESYFLTIVVPLTRWKSLLRAHSSNTTCLVLSFDTLKGLRYLGSCFYGEQSPVQHGGGARVIAW
jgi:hypothetical protein